MSKILRALEAIERHIVSSLLSPEANRQYREGAIAKAELQKYLPHILRISQAYVEHTPQNTLSSPISNTEVATAYALYYTSLNACKILHLLHQLSESPIPSHILDIGCGPGTVGLALWEHWRDASFKIRGVETSAPMRTIASRLFQTRNSSITKRFGLSPTLSAVPEGAFDMIFAANVLAEMSEETAKSTLTYCIERLNKRGMLVLLEPGQQAHTRRLMGLRDWVLSNHQDLIPIFPCFRADPCPMLQESESDWCHGTIEWTQPPLNRQLDDLLGFNKHRIKYSALIFQRDGTLGSGARVLTPTKKTRYGYESLLCSEAFYGITRLAKKDRTTSTRGFEKARVFDHLDLKALPASALPNIKK